MTDAEKDMLINTMLNSIQYYINTIDIQIPVKDRDTTMFIAGMQYVKDVVNDNKDMFFEENKIYN